MKGNEDSLAIDVRHHCRPYMYVIRVKIEGSVVMPKPKTFNTSHPLINIYSNENRYPSVNAMEDK